MNVQETVKEFIHSSTKKEILRYLLIISGLAAILLLGLFFLHIHAINKLKKSMVHINKERKTTQAILGKHELVKKQQQEVDAILEQDKTFKIKEFFTQTVSEVGLEANNTKPAEVSEQEDLGNGYAEIKLDASFTNISMQQLCNLVYALEKNPRIYTKELVITKVPNKPKIDVTLVVATLQPKEL